MERIKGRRAFAAACLAIGIAVAAPAAAEEMKGMEMTPAPTDAAPKGGGADAAYAKAMETMMKAMHAKPTGDADRDFVTMMMPHHQGAIDMAKVELQYGKDPMLRKLAAAIVKAQEEEIAEMKAWKGSHAK